MGLVFKELPRKFAELSKMRPPESIFPRAR
jgi:hypothetical protein